jgi:uncharacterized protein YndB with AHSA1/START domain
MESKTRIQISKDLKNKKVTITRDFDAPLELVWKAWTESKLLDQWWAPKPWVTKTKSLTFKDGGVWLYAMTGPDGTAIWNIVEFTAVSQQQGFQATSSFCDENGNRNPDFPTMHWKNVFSTLGTETRVEVEISFTKEADMEKIIAMGFEAGFTSALGNLDELLAGLSVKIV